MLLTFYTLEESNDTYRDHNVNGCLVLNGVVCMQTFVFLVTVKIFISASNHTKLSSFIYLMGVIFYFT